MPIACCGMRDGCSVTAVVQTNTEGKSALNRGIGKVLRNGKITGAKTKHAKCEDRSV